VKARTERSAKSSQRSGEQKKTLSHVLLRAYVKRPKNAAERKERLDGILRGLDRMYPNAECALHHSNPWELLVATILSAQCTDKRVNEVTPGLFAKYPTIEDFAAVRAEVLAQDIKSTGFFNNKAKSIVGAANAVYHGCTTIWPDNAIDLPPTHRSLRKQKRLRKQRTHKMRLPDLADGQRRARPVSPREPEHYRHYRC
jgi:3-methyladenine DNA glycosylase/8-oxoguanine DNA glycosylase